MKITFRTFLLASVALGCLQIDGFAMDEPPQKAIHQKKNSSDSDSEDIQREKILSHLMDVEHKNQRQVYEEGAQKGDKDACYHLANYYYFGRQFLEKPEDIKTSYYKEGKERIYYQIGFLKVTEEDYEKAFDLYKKSGDQGHAAALWSVGECYELQRGVKENLDLAKFYYMASAKLNYPPAQRSLGLLYLEGLGGLEKSDSEAVQLFSKAADKGLPSAQVNFGMMYFLGRGVPQSDFKALELFHEAAARGSASAQTKIGEMHKHGRGVKKSNPQAIKWFQKAADQGYEPAKKSLEELRKNDPMTAKNTKTKFESQKRIQLEDMDAESQFQMGERYRLGIGTPQSYSEGAKWFLKAAERRHAAAQHNLGVLYFKGWGVEQSYEEAVPWFQKAANQGNADAQHYLGIMYNEGLGVEPSHEEAVSCYRKAANQGHADAQVILGMRYLGGNRGVEQSNEKALGWFQKAANQGNSFAQFYLGVMYSKGLGVKPSDEEAVSWFQKAANQGNSFAQFLLGKSYIEGRGVKQSDEEAAGWFQKAADQGDQMAQSHLALMYTQDRAIPKDSSKAIKWIQRAEVHGCPSVSTNLDEMRKKQRKGHEKAIPEELPKRNPAPQKNPAPQGANSSQWFKEQEPRKVQPVQHKVIPEQQAVDLSLGRAQLAWNIQNYKEALEYFHKAAKLGNASAFNSIGLMCEDGLGITKSDIEAAKYYLQAAERGHAKAQANLGRMYREGFGVPQSDVEAVKWYKLSAAQDFAPGQSNLGMMYVLGRGVPQDIDKAAKYLRRAADQGYAPAQLNLSELYRTGNGVRQNKAESVKLRSKAESQGIDFTTQGYPRTYYTPGVVQRDIDEVRMAAEQGNIAAQCHMGMMYIDGLQGVKQDYAEALKWFHKAAENGDIAATCCIGMMHMNGQGMEKNELEAQKWLKKAASKGDINAQSIVENRSKRNMDKKPAIAHAAEEGQKWAPSDGDFIQAGNLVMTLKMESGKSPDANEMLVYIQNKMNLSPDQIKFILEELGLANF